MSRRRGSLKDDYNRLEADFHVMANSIPQLAWMTRPDGWIFWFNQRWFDYTGTTLEQMEGWGWRRVHHQDHVDRVVAKIKASFETGEPWEDVFPLRGKDGKYRWFLSRALPVRDENGEILRWFGTNTDVTEQKESEERQALLMREVDHRAKNVLAVAQAIVNLTRADTIEGYKSAVEGRIGALSRAHNLLAASRWEGADLRALLQHELAPFAGEDPDRVQLDGAAEALLPSVAQPLALVIHELATNAAKYGALSAQAGKLFIRWERTKDGLTLDWRETGGPAVKPPTREGFGSVLLKTLVHSLESSSIDREWIADGLHCKIAISAQPLPRAQPPLSPARRKQGGDQKPSILIVEDEALTALDLEYKLLESGFHIAGTVGSLARARQVLTSHFVDAAILDGNLNGERSYPLAEELVAAGIPVIFCTGYEKLEDIPDSLKGCPIVIKPFSDKALITAVKSSLSRR